MLRRFPSVALLFGLAAAGCGWRFPLLPDTRTATDHAREIDSRCTRVADRTGAEGLTAAMVESVEPDYATVMSQNDRAIHLRGAKLRLRPDTNMSAEALQRRLECHEALVTLGQVSELSLQDPFVLSDVWLDIHVDSSGDGFVASVDVDKYDIDDAKRVLKRAYGFAASAR